MRNRCYLTVLLIVTFWLLAVPNAWAQSFGYGEVYLKNNQEGPVFLTGTTIVVDSVINGDAYLVAGEVTVRGIVKGDLFCLAQKVTIEGKVDGDIRLLAGDMELNGPCTGTVTALGDSFWLWKEAYSKDMFLAVGSTQLNGKIDGRLRGQVDTGYINGTITGKTDLRANQQLSLGPQAQLLGGLDYEAPHKVKTEAGFKINGATKYKSIPPPQKEGINLTAVIISWLSALIVWWLAGIIKPAFWREWGLTLAYRPWISLFLGALAVMSLPPLIMLLVFSVVGIPAALMLAIMAVVIGYLGRIVVAIGFAVHIARNTRMKPGIAVILVMLPLMLLAYVPGVGLMFVLTYGCLGLGSLIFSMRRKRRGQEIDHIV